MKKTTPKPTQAFLEFLSDAAKMLPMPFETPYAWIRRAGDAGGMSKIKYHGMVNRLKKRGVIAVTQKSDRRFIQLTSKGQLQTLLLKSRLPRTKTWDGKWRLVMFDIPEQSKYKRDQLRTLLKKDGFAKIQESVFISPYPISRHGVEYLKTTGLINYIRMLRVDEMDDEKELLNKFKLPKQTTRNKK
jgi:phenylacetic acid degradation operon negative regulatory protein